MLLTGIPAGWLGCVPVWRGGVHWLTRPRMHMDMDVLERKPGRQRHSTVQNQGENTMKTEMLRYFRDVLDARLREVMPVMLRLDSCLKEEREHKDPVDEVELTARMSEKQRVAQIQHRTQRLVQEIREAIRRLKSGDFGICAECGMDIEIERLKVQPMTTLCIHCKREMELMGRLKVA